MAITWFQDSVATMPLRRFVGQVGTVAVGAVDYDAANGFWVWSSPLAEDAWGWAASEDGAKKAFELWLRQWLENFRPFFM